jgi:hypothetical protein
VSDTVAAVALKAALRPFSWVCAASLARSCRRFDSCAISAIAVTTTGLMLSPARRALAVRASFSDWPTESARPV